MQPLTPGLLERHGIKVPQRAALLAQLPPPPAVEEAPRADPAPSRLAYRVQRWWLTPVIRTGVRIGLPLLAALGLGTWYFSDQGRRDALTLWVDDMRASIQERPEFMVQLMAIDGASAEVAEDIREILHVDFPISSFDLDLEHMRQAALGLDAVAGASIRIRPGGVLGLEITERVPVLVWRSRQGLELLDETGHRTASLDARLTRSDLPLILGAGADAHAAEALSIYRTATPIRDDIIALQRMGQRRWDVVLTKGRRVLLPENGPVRALERVIALHQAQDMLTRDIAAVDMRNPARPTLRMRERALPAYQELRTMSAGVESQ